MVIPIQLKSRRGFTLIEVLVCLAILAIALLGFHQGQAGSIKIASRAEVRAQAYALAQRQMTEVELQLKHKNFAGFSDEEKGEFKEDEFKKFRWVRKFEKVDVGCFLPEPSADSGEAGFYQLAEKFFTESIRKIKVTVAWEENKKIQKATLTQLYVDWKSLPSIP
ncbi:MAG: hypothetical protein JWQ35_410 [Bacteriovoracaceae bacterium]|nr:hypothetical protein [Bacteriovoracaceae bacterium]